MIVHPEKQDNSNYTSIVTADGSGMDFGLLRLGQGEVYNQISEREQIFLLIRGAVVFEWEGGVQRVRRDSMLEENPAVLHIPHGSDVTIRSLDGDTELTVHGAENQLDFVPRFYSPSSIRVTDLRMDSLNGTADRVLKTACDDENSPHSNLAVGEVITKAGCWSSYPPHHHPQLEIYHYRFFPQCGFGYCGMGSEAYLVKDGDTVLIQPDAVHPQVAAPGYTMVYVWAIRHLPGNRFGGESRIFAPEHTWILDG
jgi:5-deoxy-glucuronate isomerase